jgi:hypothetical protein
VPADQAQQLAIQVPELVRRNEPARREAFIYLGLWPHADPAQWPLITVSLQRWAQVHKVQTTGLDALGVRLTYLWDATVPAGQGPDCDFALPFN